MRAFILRGNDPRACDGDPQIVLRLGCDGRNDDIVLGTRGGLLCDAADRLERHGR
jgi:hypothetical protein